MAEKNYETSAKKVQMILYNYRNELNEVGQACSKIKADPGRTDIGKKGLLDDLLKELKDLIAKKSNEIKTITKDFCDKYEIIYVDDDGKYSQEISNALQVINLCGFNLTTDLLRGAIEPLKSSYSAMKLIHGVITSKNNNPMVGYEPSVLIMMDDYMGTNGDIEVYNDALNDIRDVLNYPNIVDGTITGSDATRYSVLCLADNMIKVGRLYDEISIKYPHLFK